MSDALATGLGFKDFLLSRNRSYYTVDAADVSLTDRTTLKYFLEIQVPENRYYGNFVKLHESEGREKPLISGPGGSTVYEGVTFPFNQRNGKLDGFLEFSKPQFDYWKMQVVLSQTMQYRLRERITGGTPTQAIDRTLTAGWVMKAGLASEDLLHTDFLTAQQSVNRRFLTYQPNGQVIGYQQEIYLSFLINFSPTPSELRLRASFGGEMATIDTISSPAFGSIVICPIRADKIAAFLTANYELEVWLSDQNNARLSEVRKFYIEDYEPEYSRTILYQNSLGGWDTIRLTGQAERQLKLAKVKAERERYKREGIDFVASLVVAQESEYYLTINTGWIEEYSETWKAVLSELMLAEQIYLSTEKGHRFVELDMEEYVDEKDEENRFARSLTFRYVDVDSNFSNLTGVGVGTVVRPTGWRGVGYVHVLDSFGKRTGKMSAVRLQRIYTDDNSVYKPLTYKLNMPGTEGYIPVLTDPSITVGSTPYPSAAISREGSYIRSVCTTGTPGRATITIAAGKYGGEKAGDADALAELEFSATDTQAYADANGVCYPDPWNYAVNVPANYAHFRWNKMRTSYADNYINKDNSTASIRKGNGWFLQIDHAGEVDVYQSGTNNIQLPTNFSTTSWRFGVYGTVTCKIYVNGTLINTTYCSDFTAINIPNASIPSQAKVYVLIS